MSLVLFGEVMLTWDESSSTAPRSASVNKVIIVSPIERDKMFATMKSLYESFLTRCVVEPLYVSVRCAYEWLLKLVIEHTKPQQPITPENKTNKAGSHERPRHFFSAHKLNMRNAP